MIDIKPVNSNLNTQIEELKQTPDHRLTPFDVRIRRLLVQIYELLEDLQIQNKQLHNRIELLSSKIVDELPNLKPSKKETKQIE
jgi:hypothetical protein